MNNNSISIIGGAGHIGLPLAVKFAENNFNICIIDKNKKNSIKIKNKIPPFKEKDLKNRLKNVINKNKISISTNLEEIQNSKYIFICLGTPISNNLKPDLNTFFNVIKTIKKYLNKDSHLVIRSSVLPGTCKKILKIISSKCSNLTYCPERIVEGKSLHELPVIPQIISGSNTNTEKEVKKIFIKITKNIIFCNFIEAELSKIFSNMFRYINFAIPNEMYLISKKLGADFNKIWNVMKYKYPRNNGLAKAGFVGGPCLMKDTMQISYLFGKKVSLMNSAFETNEKLPEKILEIFHKEKNFKNKTIGILGLTFKPESDDLRGSTSFKLLKLLKKKRYKFLFSDPFIDLQDKISEKKLIRKSDIIIIGTNHKKYKNLKIDKKKTVIDISGYLN